jgi:Autoinducer binding domain
MNSIAIPNSSRETLEQMGKTLILSQEQQLYKSELIKKLSEAGDEDGFVSAISHELTYAFGIKDWALAPLDLPASWCAHWHLGHINADYTAIYGESGYYDVDLILQHLNKKDTSIFFSDVENDLNSLRFFSNDRIDYEKIACLNRKFGYDESFNIPLRSPKNGYRVVLSITSKDICANTFKQNALRHIRTLHTFGAAIVEVAMTKHSKTFLMPHKEYKSLTSDYGFDFLSYMGTEDIGINEAVARQGISVSTGKRVIRDLKTILNTKTIHGTIHKAVCKGLIKPTPTTTYTTLADDKEAALDN